MVKRALWGLGVWLALGGVVWGQEPEEEFELPEWAPEWRVGDTWVVRTYQRDLRERIETPTPAEGGAPYIPGDDRADLPGFPPLRDGVPVGFKRGNRFRFEVHRRESVEHEGDEPGLAPEEFWVVRVSTMEGRERRRAELWYSVEEMAFSKVVLHPGTEDEEERWLRGEVPVDVEGTEVLGLPLVWIHWPTSEEPRSEHWVEGGRPVEQWVRRGGEGEQRFVQVRLVQSEGDAEDEEFVTRAQFMWRPGRKWWTRLLVGDRICELVP